MLVYDIKLEQYLFMLEQYFVFMLEQYLELCWTNIWWLFEEENISLFWREKYDFIW